MDASALGKKTVKELKLLCYNMNMGSSTCGMRKAELIQAILEWPAKIERERQERERRVAEYRREAEELGRFIERATAIRDARLRVRHAPPAQPGDQRSVYELSGFPSDMIYEVCRPMDHNTLYNFMISSKIVYEACKPLLERFSRVSDPHDPNINYMKIYRWQDAPKEYRERLIVAKQARAAVRERAIAKKRVEAGKSVSDQPPQLPVRVGNYVIYVPRRFPGKIYLDYEWIINRPVPYTATDEDNLYVSNTASVTKYPAPGSHVKLWDAGYSLPEALKALVPIHGRWTDIALIPNRLIPAYEAGDFSMLALYSNYIVEIRVRGGIVVFIGWDERRPSENSDDPPDVPDTPDDDSD